MIFLNSIYYLYEYVFGIYYSGCTGYKNTCFSYRASAVAIGQALLEAGYVVCISQLEQVCVDDYVLYRPVRPSTGGSEQTTQEGLNRAQDGGQEDLWVKQINLMAESIGES